MPNQEVLFLSGKVVAGIFVVVSSLFSAFYNARSRAALKDEQEKRDQEKRDQEELNKKFEHIWSSIKDQGCSIKTLRSQVDELQGEHNVNACMKRVRPKAPRRRT